MQRHQREAGHQVEIQSDEFVETVLGAADGALLSAVGLSKRYRTAVALEDSTVLSLALPDVFMCRGTYPLTPPLPFTAGQEAAGKMVFSRSEYSQWSGAVKSISQNETCKKLFTSGHAEVSIFDDEEVDGVKFRRKARRLP